MINLKKIKIDWIFTGTVLALILFLITLIISIIFSFYYFNNISSSKLVIDDYIEQVSLIKIDTQKANEVINFVPLSTEIKIDNSNNPFRIIEIEEK